jgi:uncharacterized membrane protein
MAGVNATKLAGARRLGLLGGGLVVCLALIPLQIDSAFGLPAHPLLLHVPVVFDPLLALATLVLVARPDLRRRYGFAWAVFALFCLAATILTAGAGQAFYDQRPFVEDVLRQHKEAGETLRTVAIGLTVAILALVTLDWARSLPAGPRALRGRALAVGLSGVVALLALGTGFFTIRAGHLGAKAAWGREAGERPAGAGQPGAGQPGF